MRRTSFAATGLSLLSLSLFSLPGFAHETPSPNWCSSTGGTLVVTSTFNFTPAQLQQYAEISSPPTNCGVVDDWHWARQMAQSYCASHAGNFSTALPMVQTPGSFNNQNLHHALYTFGQGLAGTCGACVPPPLPSD